MQLYLEVFFTQLADDAVLFLKELCPITHDEGAPDHLVRELLARTFPSGRPTPGSTVIHSTSWRYEAGGRLILTYLVYDAALNLGARAAQRLRLGDLEVARGTEATAPHPPQVSETHVLAHGLRHLSFLAQTDPPVRRALGVDSGTLALLARFPADVAGALPAAA